MAPLRHKFWLPSAPFSKHFHEHVVFAQNAPRTNENAFLEVMGSQNASILGTIPAYFSIPFRDPLWDPLLESFVSPWCSNGPPLVAIGS